MSEVYEKVSIRVERASVGSSVFKLTINQLGKEAVVQEMACRQGQPVDMRGLFKNIPGFGAGNEIQLLSDGSIVLGKMSANIGLTLDSPAKIVTTQPVALTALSLRAENIILQTDLNIARQCQLYPSKTLDNFADTQVKGKLIIDAEKATINNHHRLWSEDTLIIRNEREIHNKGMMGSARKVDAQINNFFIEEHAVFAAKSANIRTTKEKTGACGLHNDGQFFIDDDLHFSMKGDSKFINRGDFVAGTISRLLAKRAKNFGHVEVMKNASKKPTSFGLTVRRRFTNYPSGTIKVHAGGMRIKQGKKGLWALSHGDIINMGNIDVQGQFLGQTDGQLINKADAKLVAGGGVDLRGRKLFYNDGLIDAKNKTASIFVASKEKSYNLGQIKGRKVKYLSSGGLKNKDAITGKELININLGGNLENLGQAKISSEMKAELQVVKNIINDAEIEAKDLLIQAGGKVINKKSGKIKGHRTCDVTSYSVINQGEMGGKVIQLLTSVFAQGKTGSIKALDKLHAISYFKWDNKGLLSAANQLIAKTFGKLTNHVTGQMVSQKSMAISAEKVKLKGKQKAGRLHVKSLYGDITGKFNVDHATVEIHQFGDTSKLITQTGKYKNANFKKSLHVKTDRRVKLDRAVNKSFALGVTASSIDVKKSIKVKHLELTSTEENIDINAPIDVANDMISTSQQETINHGQAIKVGKDYTGKAKGDYKNIDGTIDVKAMAEIEGASVISQRSDQNHHAGISADTLSIQSTKKDVVTNDTLTGRTCLDINAKRDVKAECLVYSVQGKHDVMHPSLPAVLSGGKGTEATRGYGASVKAGNKVKIHASTLESTGHNYIKGKKGVDISGRVDGYVSHRETKSSLLKKTCTEETTIDVYGANVISHQGRNEIDTEQSVDVHSGNLLSKQGTVMRGKNIKMDGVKATKTKSVSKSKFFGLSKSSSTIKQEQIIPNYIYDEGHSEIHAENSVNVTDTIIDGPGGGRGDLTVTGQDINISCNKLTSTIETKKSGVSISLFGMKLIDTLDKGGSPLEALAAENATIAKCKGVFDAKGVAGKAQAAWNAGIALSNTYKQFAAAKEAGNLKGYFRETTGLGNKDKVDPKITLTYTEQKNKAQMQTRGPGYIRKENITLSGPNGSKASNITLGGGVPVRGKRLKVKAKKFVQEGAHLESWSRSETKSASVSATASGQNVEVGLAYSKQKSESVTHTPEAIVVDHAELEVDEHTMDVATIKAKTVSGHIGKQTRRSRLDTHKSSSFSASASTSGGFSCNVSSSKSGRRGTTSNITATERNSLIIDKEIVDNGGDEYDDTGGFGISGNVNDLLPSDKSAEKNIDEKAGDKESDQERKPQEPSLINTWNFSAHGNHFNINLDIPTSTSFLKRSEEVKYENNPIEKAPVHKAKEHTQTKGDGKKAGNDDEPIESGIILTDVNQGGDDKTKTDLSEVPVNDTVSDNKNNTFVLPNDSQEGASSSMQAKAKAGFSKDAEKDWLANTKHFTRLGYYILGTGRTIGLSDLRAKRLLKVFPRLDEAVKGLSSLPNNRAANHIKGVIGEKLVAWQMRSGGGRVLSGKIGSNGIDVPCIFNKEGCEHLVHAEVKATGTMDIAHKPRLKDTKYGTQMSDPWMHRKCDQMIKQGGLRQQLAEKTQQAMRNGKGDVHGMVARVDANGASYDLNRCSNVPKNNQEMRLIDLDSKDAPKLKTAKQLKMARYLKKAGLGLSVVSFASDAYEIGSKAYEDINRGDGNYKETAKATGEATVSWIGGAALTYVCVASLGALGVTSAPITIPVAVIAGGVGSVLGGMGGKELASRCVDAAADYFFGEASQPVKQVESQSVSQTSTSSSFFRDPRTCDEAQKLQQQSMFQLN